MMKRFLFTIGLCLVSLSIYGEDRVNALENAKNSVFDLIDARETRQNYVDQVEKVKPVESVEKNKNSTDKTDYLGKAKEVLLNYIPNLNAEQISNLSATTMRDPFNISGGQGPNQGGIGSAGFGSSFLPDIGSSKVPKLKLKGVINQATDKPEDLIALLEIDGKDVHMVKIGDEISYDPSNPAAAIKIIKIKRLSLKVQIGSIGSTFIVR